MAVTEKLKDVKVVLNLTKGSQTIPGCKVDATADELYALGSAVSTLVQEELEEMTKVQETILVQ